MDRADEELRETIKKIWPIQSAKKLDIFVPPKEGNNTVLPNLPGLF